MEICCCAMKEAAQVKEASGIPSDINLMRPYIPEKGGIIYGRLVEY